MIDHRVSSVESSALRRYPPQGNIVVEVRAGAMRYRSGRRFASHHVRYRIQGIGDEYFDHIAKCGKGARLMQHTCLDFRRYTFKFGLPLLKIIFHNQVIKYRKG